MNDSELRIFAVSIADIEKAFEIKRKYTPQEIENLLPNQVRSKAQVFNEYEKPPTASQ